MWSATSSAGSLAGLPRVSCRLACCSVPRPASQERPSSPPGSRPCRHCAAMATPRDWPPAPSAPRARSARSSHRASLLILLSKVLGLSVGTLLAAAMLPGLVLAAIYVLAIILLAFRHCDLAPPIDTDERAAMGRGHLLRRMIDVVRPPLALVVAVLDSIIGGGAAPTEAASMAAVGALVIVARTFSPQPVFAVAALFWPEQRRSRLARRPDRLAPADLVLDAPLRLGALPTGGRGSVRGHHRRHPPRHAAVHRPAACSRLPQFSSCPGSRRVCPQRSAGSAGQLAFRASAFPSSSFCRTAPAGLPGFRVPAWRTALSGNCCSGVYCGW